MAKCDCGADSTRLRTVMTAGGKLLKESQRQTYCPTCRPEEFHEAFDPFDRLATGPEAMPNMYKRDSEGVYHAKDELLADTAAMWDKGPTAKAKDIKLATRRTAPLSDEEVNQAKDWGERRFADAYREAFAKSRQRVEDEALRNGYASEGKLIHG